MDNKFIVSARKYRPQNFNTVVGQSHITTTLKNAIKNEQLAHAFLFCGPRGVGKTTCARILAKTINCTNQTPDGEACNQCNSCVSFDAGTSLNIHELDAASNNSVDDIRSLVEQVRFAPQAGKYKVYIVDEVHMLSASAFNAFLKTLEEPPSYAIFILATTEKHKILPTILSRCQIFDFKRITNNDTVEHLQEIVDKEEIKAEKAALQVIAQKSEGCMRDSLSILDKIVSFTNGTVTYQNTLEHLNILDEDYYFKLLDAMLQQDMSAAMLLYDEINRKGFEGDLVLNGFAEFIRNLLVCKDPKSASLLEVVEDMQNKYVSVASGTGLSYLVSALNILNEAEINYKMARNKRLHVELTLIKLNFLQQAIDLSVDNGHVVKKKRLDAPVAFKTQHVTPVQFKPALPEAKLYIEQQPVAPTAKQPAVVPPVKTTPVTPPPVAPAQTIPAARTMPVSNGTKKSLLDILREKAGNKYSVTAVPDAEPITMERLRECFNNYAVVMKEQQKHSSAEAFRSARLSIESEIRFTITVPAIYSQKMIEQERMMLLDLLYEVFKNRTIGFDVMVDPSEQEEVPLALRMNNREKFEYIANQYPLVKELKDRLKLDLD